MRTFLFTGTSTVFVSHTDPSVNQTRRSCKLTRKQKSQIIAVLVVLIVLITIITIVTFSTRKRDTNISTTGFITTTTTTTTTTEITTTTEGEVDVIRVKKWRPNGTTVAGGNGRGDALNQLLAPYSIYIDDDGNQTILIVDWGNHRVMEWKSNATTGRIFAGGSRSGSDTSHFLFPGDITYDQKTDSMIISDPGNTRIMRWSHRNATHGEILMSDVSCMGLATDKDGYLYMTDTENHRVRKWNGGRNNGSTVAHGFVEINQTRMPLIPYFLAIDTNGSIYASNMNNDVVVKWTEGAETGIIVAGGNGRGDQLTQLSEPMGIALDDFDNLYIADSKNHRIVCWMKGAKEGRVVVGGNDNGVEPDQLSWPYDLSFDKYGHLYVADTGNERIQKFQLDSP